MLGGRPLEVVFWAGDLCGGVAQCRAVLHVLGDCSMPSLDPPTWLLCWQRRCCQVRSAFVAGIIHANITDPALEGELRTALCN
jgi:hypothetical protein